MVLWVALGAFVGSLRWTKAPRYGIVARMGPGVPTARPSGITVAGRTFGEEEVRRIAEVVRSCSMLSRYALAARVCELLEWRRAQGQLKARECRDLLEELQRCGIVTLPAKRAGRPVGRRTGVPHTIRGDAGEPLAGSLAEVGPLELVAVERADEHAVWRELVGRHHYLGHATPFGAQRRYLIKTTAARPTIVGCLQYSSAAWRLRVRDQWIGWTESARQRNLPAVIQQSRFLLLPWIRVRHLASHVLALSARRLVHDWRLCYGRRPLLLETMVDDQRFAGTCYRAANWIDLGLTTGRGRMDRDHQRHGAWPKRVFVYPLHPRARAQLQRAQ